MAIELLPFSVSLWQKTAKRIALCDLLSVASASVVRNSLIKSDQLQQALELCHRYYIATYISHLDQSSKRQLEEKSKGQAAAKDEDSKKWERCDALKSDVLLRAYPITEVYAVALLKLGDYDGARTELQRALRFNEQQQCFPAGNVRDFKGSASGKGDPALGRVCADLKKQITSSHRQAHRDLLSLAKNSRARAIVTRPSGRSSIESPAATSVGNATNEPGATGVRPAFGGHKDRNVAGNDSGHEQSSFRQSQRGKKPGLLFYLASVMKSSSSVAHTYAGNADREDSINVRVNRTPTEHYGRLSYSRDSFQNYRSNFTRMHDNGSPSKPNPGLRTSSPTTDHPSRVPSYVKTSSIYDPFLQNRILSLQRDRDSAPSTSTVVHLSNKTLGVFEHAIRYPPLFDLASLDRFVSHLSSTIQRRRLYGVPERAFVSSPSFEMQRNSRTSAFDGLLKYRRAAGVCERINVALTMLFPPVHSPLLQRFHSPSQSAAVLNLCSSAMKESVGSGDLKGVRSQCVTGQLAGTSELVSSSFPSFVGDGHDGRKDRDRELASPNAIHNTGSATNILEDRDRCNEGPNGATRQSAIMHDEYMDPQYETEKAVDIGSGPGLAVHSSGMPSAAAASSRFELGLSIRRTPPPDVILPVLRQYCYFSGSGTLNRGSVRLSYPSATECLPYYEYRELCDHRSSFSDDSANQNGSEPSTRAPCIKYPVDKKGKQHIASDLVFVTRICFKRTGLAPPVLL